MSTSVLTTINFADFSVFADMYNDTGEKWNIHDDDIRDVRDVNDVNQVNDDALKDYYDAYCSYLVSRKYTTDIIKTYRKKAIIDFYITENKFDNSMRKELDSYYDANIKDNFNKKLDPPICFFHQVRMEKKNEEAREQRDIDTDDVAQHYINLKNMYKNVYNMMNNTTTNNNNLNNMSDNIHSECDDIESINDKYTEYYDDYYNIYDSDYYSDNNYYSDGYSDDYDHNDY